MDYTNSRINEIIDEYIHDEKHRHILKRRYIDHVTYERLAEEMGLDDSTVKRIVKRCKPEILKHL